MPLSRTQMLIFNRRKKKIVVVEKNASKEQSSTITIPSPSVAGESDESTISHPSEQKTDSFVFAVRRTKHPAEEVTCAPPQHTHTHTDAT